MILGDGPRMKVGVFSTNEAGVDSAVTATGFDLIYTQIPCNWKNGSAQTNKQTISTWESGFQLTKNNLDKNVSLKHETILYKIL